MVKKIAVLALQGDYELHAETLRQIGLKPQLLRNPEQLHEAEGLVIPGGESTTMSKLILSLGLHSPLKAFAEKHPILGTCAGLILMSQLHTDTKVHPLEILDIEVSRNAYGRQSNSFFSEVSVTAKEQTQKVEAYFIRAPKITKVGATVSILAEHNGDPVAVSQGQHIGLTFHPELNQLAFFHKLAFLPESYDE